MTQWVYHFGGGSSEGDRQMRALLGGKGANLAEMASLGLPVPPGFTISTAVCTHYYAHQKTYPETLQDQLSNALQDLEKKMGHCFGDPADPLLVSVRSGAPVSMPGMMDTVLNLGLNDETVQGLAAKSGDQRFAWDSYRRFIQMYGNVVLGIALEHFEAVLDSHKKAHALEKDTDVSSEGWQEIVHRYKKIVQQECGFSFPQDPFEQLQGAICAVFDSWMSPRAHIYREIHDISDKLGTAVTVQTMVFGNMGRDCATGVAFTRDPSTGDNVFYGEYLLNAQGEDVVAGIRTPRPITEMQTDLPQAYEELLDIRDKLERHFRDVQDIEFTVQQNHLYMLQTRSAKRTAAAALKIAVHLVEDGLISQEEAILRLDPKQLDQLLHPTLDPAARTKAIAKGLAASPGAASGVIAFTADEAEAMAARGEKVILCRTETSPEDIHGMHAAAGILTTRGGMTSHAAVVARGMGKPCVSGAGSLIMNAREKIIWVDMMELREGDQITIDGASGEVFQGKIATIDAELSEDFAAVMGWADQTRRMHIRTNAETPQDAQKALSFGAEGIGLCRTEHMFFDPERILQVRIMILAHDEENRKKALNKLLPEQRRDFIELFRLMDGLPVTIRLLDPPLHEFLPHQEEDIAEFASEADVEESFVRRRLAELHECNPMLGHRGCRLGITFPAIYEMQARAILEAALAVRQEGVSVSPEIMIPLAGTGKELSLLKSSIAGVAREIFAEKDATIPYLLGTMIELPRSALLAEELASNMEFFSFGTNDLTQTAMGLSRDDSAHFMASYLEQGIFEKDPFATLDVEGVGELVEIAAQRGRLAKPGLKLGVCGEHGGDPASITFFEKVGLDYVSCSPFRVPIARLAAAQATVLQRRAGQSGARQAA